MRRFWHDESAQASVEYILMLSVVVGFFMTFRRFIVQRFGQLQASIQSQIMRNFSSDAALHHYSM